MRQRPDADDFVRLADAILRDNPLPDDPKDRSYEQRMALKACRIAGFDRACGPGIMAEEIMLFTALYGDEIVKKASDDDTVRVAALNRRLASEIRSGAWDEAPPALIALLTGQVCARLARSNPRYLKATFPDSDR